MRVMYQNNIRSRLEIKDAVEKIPDILKVRHARLSHTWLNPGADPGFGLGEELVRAKLVCQFLRTKRTRGKLY